jgi:hypothetical protein
MGRFSSHAGELTALLGLESHSDLPTSFSTSLDDSIPDSFEPTSAHTHAMAGFLLGFLTFEGFL